MLDQRNPDVKHNKSKPLRNACLVYQYDINPKISPTSIISTLHYDGTFHQTMKFFLTISQVFGLMPLYGISAPTPKSLYFSFCSMRTLYSILVIVLNLALAGIIVYFNIVTECTFDKIFPLIWFTINPFVMFQFIRIATKWPSLIQHWEAFEMTVACRDSNTHRKMRKIILASSIGVPVLALVEHVFSLANNFNNASLCKTVTDKLSAYFAVAFPAYFYFFNANYVNAICLQMLNLYCTFAWSMTDAFILLVCLGLITQFRHFNTNFERNKGMHLPPDFWSKQRIYFTKLTQLVDHVNNDLAVLILTSFTVNTFYICVQLFESITSSDSAMRLIYFWYSLIYLIGKTLAVSMIATLINDEAKKPIKVLESLPAAVYGSEAARFMHQLTSGTIALGGMKFFYITRTFLISMVGTIITYEMILMQFQNRREVDFDPCEW